jgi:hypothetical protein
VEHLAAVIQPERTEVDQEVMLVRGRQPDFGDLLVGREHRRAHLPQALLECAAVYGRELFDQHPADAGVDRVPVGVRTEMTPASGQRRGQHPVVGLRQRRVPVAQESGELRSRRLEQDEIPHARQDPGPLLVPPARDRYRRRSHFLAGPDERVRVVTVRVRYPIPGELVDLDARRLDRLDVVGKMPG